MPRPVDLSLIGKTYNDLKVIEYTDQRNNYGRGLYRCKCLLCGGEKLATKANLIKGEVKNCGCAYHKPKNDLTRKTYDRLTVVGTTVINGKLKYICDCSCGNTGVIANPQDLRRGSKKSCGCIHKGDEAFAKSLYVEGTAPCKLNGNNIRSTNTSGVTGVWYDKRRGKWTAEIVFQKKKHYLGRFEDKEEAIKVRKEAEKNIFGDFLKWYEAYKEELKNDQI